METHNSGFAVHARFKCTKELRNHFVLQLRAKMRTFSIISLPVEICMPFG
jgi:hypothetical protein